MVEKVNTNSLGNSQFQFSIEKLENLKLMCQGVNLPGIAIGSIEQFVPKTEISFDSHRISYSPFVVRFLVDDNMDNYVKLHDWMIEIINTDDGHLSLYTNASLIIYNRNYKAVREVHFKGCYCTSLSDLEFDTTNDESIIQCTATFEFTDYDFRKP